MKTLEEHKQAVDIEEITKQVKRRRKSPDATREKSDWLGVCFFLDGNAWLYIDGDNRCIGKEAEIRKACKLYNTDVENPSDIKNAMIRWRRENRGLENSLCKETKPLISASYASTGHGRRHKESLISERTEKQLVLV